MTDRNDERTRLIKVGGSLLGSSVLPRCLESLCAESEHVATYWVAGGGAVADVVREWDRKHALGDSLAYELTLQGLAVTECFLTAILHRMGLDPAPCSVLDFREEEAATGGEDGDEAPGRPRHRVVSLTGLARVFPAAWVESYRLETWEASSDTMAALAARWYRVDELVLLKPCAIDDIACDLEAAVTQGIVDSVFPRAIRGLRRVTLVSAGS